MIQATHILSAAVEEYKNIVSIADAVDAAGIAITNSLRAGGHIFFCGNGGSASDAMHLAAELLGRFKKERAPWAATALVSNVSAQTAIANDYGYERVFSRQLRGLGRRGDVLVGISTSGNSVNVIEAFETAKDMGLYCIALTGASDSKMRQLADIAVCVPSTQTPRIQEMHITVGHTICELVENALTEGDTTCNA